MLQRAVITLPAIITYLLAALTPASACPDATDFIPHQIIYRNGQPVKLISIDQTSGKETTLLWYRVDTDDDPPEE